MFGFQTVPKSEQNGLDFRQCLKTEPFGNGTLFRVSKIRMFGFQTITVFCFQDLSLVQTCSGWTEELWHRQGWKRWKENRDHHIWYPLGLLLKHENSESLGKHASASSRSLGLCMLLLPILTLFSLIRCVIQISRMIKNITVNKCKTPWS